MSDSRPPYICSSPVVRQCVDCGSVTMDVEWKLITHLSQGTAAKIIFVLKLLKVELQQ